MKVRVDLVEGSNKRTETVTVADGLQGLQLMNAAEEAVAEQLRPGESIVDVHIIE